MASVRSARDPPDRALLMTSYIVLKHISMKHENRKVGINNCMKTENLNIYHSWKWSQHGFTDRSNKGPVENPLDGYDVYVLCSIVCFCFCQPYNIMILCVCVCVSWAILLLYLFLLFTHACFWCILYIVGPSCHQGRLPPQWKLDEISEILCRLSFRRLVELCPCSREPIFQKAMGIARLCQVEDA